MQKHAVLLGGREISVGKILCVGRNYTAHAAEMGGEPGEEPFFFLKPTTALVRPDGGDLFIPESFGLVHHEAELAVLIGAGAGAGGNGVSTKEAAGMVAGYGAALDLTLRDLQGEAKRAGRPWSAAKGFDRSCPAGEFIPAGHVADPNDLPIVLRVNGEARQSARTSAMILTPPELIAKASRWFTFEEGDLLLTGTPEGVGPLRDGDRVSATIGGLPELALTVRRV